MLCSVPQQRKNPRLKKRGGFEVVVMLTGLCLWAMPVYAQDQSLTSPAAPTMDSLVKDMPIPQQEAIPEEAMPAEEDPLVDETPPVAEASPDNTPQDLMLEDPSNPDQQTTTSPPSTVPQENYTKAKVVFLEKRMGHSEVIPMKMGETVIRQGLSITVKACRRKTVEAGYPLTAGFFKITPVESPLDPQKRLDIKPVNPAALALETKVFSGWMFAEHPSKTIFDNPLYDVWLVGCSRDTPPKAPSFTSTAEKIHQDLMKKEPVDTDE
jgi:hypothetical protein